MKTALAMTCCLFLLAFAQAGDDAALKKDLAGIKGKWKVQTLETPDEKKELPGASLVFGAEMYEWMHDNDAKKGTFKLNPAGKPKEIDLKPEDKDEQAPGIYQIEGDTLKVCVNLAPNGARPTEFTAKEGIIVVTLKRDKEK